MMPLPTAVANEVVLVVFAVSSAVGGARFHNGPSFRLAVSLNGRHESVHRIEEVVIEWRGRHSRHGVAWLLWAGGLCGLKKEDGRIGGVMPNAESGD